MNKNNINPTPNPDLHNEDINARPVTRSEVSYRDGYVHGRNIERDRTIQNRRIRSENNAVSGALLGILITSIIGLIIGAFFIFNTANETESPTIIPIPSAAEPENPEPPVSEGSDNTTIIERTVEKVVPVPQESAPVNPPKIEIKLPETNSSNPSNSQPQPAPAPAQPEAPTSNSEGNNLTGTEAE